MDRRATLYLLSRGTLTMRFGEHVQRIGAPAAVRLAPGTTRSHRNEGDEPVELWAVSRQLGHGDATKVDDFWEASAQASQHAG
jgi:mannose-6-phosphate isomerase-like protein (cupin superfamily)